MCYSAHNANSEYTGFKSILKSKGDSSSWNHDYPKASQILGFVAHDSNILVHVGKEYLKVEQEEGGRDAEHQECLKDYVPLCDYDASL